MNEIDPAGDIPVDNHDENTLQLPGRTRSWLAMRYGTTRKCVSNKAALLILLWSFVVGSLGAIILDPKLYLNNYTIDMKTLVIIYTYIEVFICFFPLAGILADIKFGRYNTVVTSLFIVLLAIMPFAGLTAGILTCIHFGYHRLTYLLPLVITIVPVSIIMCVGCIGFTANVVQFGMDHLHDSPGEDSTIFIHWYIWTSYTSYFCVQLASSLGFPYPYETSPTYILIGYFLLALIPVVVVMVLVITLCLVRRRRRWFLIEPGGLNPFKLVFRVTKFARQHKIPVQRSAFTYCEDELPSGLDLGKEKYGGCFTTEQVEDVKAFYGILKVLFSFGIVFFMDFAADSILHLFAFHITPHHIIINNTTHDVIFEFNKTQNINVPILFNTSHLLIVICIPLYLCLLRPFISQYVPGMLKRMGLGMFLTFVSTLVSFSVDTSAHANVNNSNASCLFRIEQSTTLDLDPVLLLIQLTLSALSHMLIYTAVLEFICSQSPHSMKGLFIGVLYAIRGLYQLVATLLAFSFAHHTFQSMSCGFWYYLMNIVIGVVALLVYTCVAKRYRYRERDEICNIHQYAEEYYSNPQQEKYYDYDSYAATQ